ncbi:hypothetical protein [Falsirhodobacter sp. 1013]|uniref:hypothetical protein n=1 Tax=Falsirhodobacter sp. 1013 TaxID=3417566 RepID=UPI003EBFCC3E
MTPFESSRGKTQAALHFDAEVGARMGIGGRHYDVLRSSAFPKAGSLRAMKSDL